MSVLFHSEHFVCSSSLFVKDFYVFVFSLDNKDSHFKSIIVDRAALHVFIQYKSVIKQLITFRHTETCEETD